MQIDGDAFELLPPDWAGKAHATLQTEIADEEGNLRATRRKTELFFYRLGGEQSWLFELGIPVVEIEGPYSVDVRQKVPLTIDRANVRPAFLADVHAVLLSRMAGQLSKPEAAEAWVSDSLGHKLTEPGAVKTVAEQRFGKNRVSFDPSDREANSRATAKGFTVVPGGALSGAAWEKLREADAIQPAGRVFPTTPEGSGSKDCTIPRAKWTPAMVKVARNTERVADLLILGDVRAKIPTAEKAISVRFVRYNGTIHSGALATFGAGSRTLSFNLDRLGKTWVEANAEGFDEEALAIVLHELAHFYESNHLDDAFAEAGFTMGARLAAIRPSQLPLRKGGAS